MPDENTIVEITETNPMQREFNKCMAIEYINEDLIARANCDIGNSWCFYDADKDFASLMLDSGIEINQKVISIIVEKTNGRIRYYSKGIV